MKTITLFFVFFSALFMNSGLVANIRILTFHYNKPDFLEIQIRAFKKFLLDKYEIIIFNDARDPQLEREIQEISEKNGIQCVRFLPEWHKNNSLNNLIMSYLLDPNNDFSNIPLINDIEVIGDQPSIRHSHVIQYALDNYGYNHNDLVILLDGDAFPIRPISIRKLMEKNQIIGAKKNIQDVEYLWVPFIALDVPKLPNIQDLKFHTDVVDSHFHDTGSASIHYLRNHPFVKVKKKRVELSEHFKDLSLNSLKKKGFSDQEAWLVKVLPKGTCVDFLINKHFLHFGGSSFDREGYDQKTRYVKEFLEKILK